MQNELYTSGTKLGSGDPWGATRWFQVGCNSTHGNISSKTTLTIPGINYRNAAGALTFALSAFLVTESSSPPDTH